MKKLLVPGIILLLFTQCLSAQTYKYYFGNLHAHTGYSDGKKDITPAKSFAFAKDSKNFNFLGISEHNHKEAGMKLPNFAKGVKEATTANKDGQFVCLYGMEYGVISKGGHVLLYGIDQLVGWEENNFDLECPKSDYESLWDLVSDFPDAFATLAHPKQADYNGLLSKPYNQTADKVICGVAIMTGPAKTESTGYDEKPSGQFTTYYRTLLAKGYHVGPTVDHDNHFMTYGRTTSSRTVVLSKDLSRDSIMEAYREMRFYASSDWNAKVSFVINGFPMGKRINTKKTATIQVKVDDPDAGDKVKTIKVMHGKPKSGSLSTALTSVNGTGTLTFSHDAKKKEEYYYYLEITQQDGDKIYTSPIWVRRP